MAVPRIDPRVTKDRIYEYGEYKVLSAQFGRKVGSSRRARGETWIGTDTQSRLRARRGLSFALLVGICVVLLVASFIYAVWLQTDILRLSYAREDLNSAIAGMDQTLAEALSATLASQVLATSSGKTGAAAVAFPEQTKYVVLTNIPAMSGGKLVEDLYPLSRGLLRIEP
jgi:hypothetical protein